MLNSISQQNVDRVKRVNKDWFDNDADKIGKMIKGKHRAFIFWQSDYANKNKKDKYQSLRSSVQRWVRELKNKQWKNKSEQIQALAAQNKPKNFSQPLERQIYGQSSYGVVPIAGKYGVRLKVQKYIIDRWHEHFCKLLNQEAVVNKSSIDLTPQAKIEESNSELPTL